MEGIEQLQMLITFDLDDLDAAMAELDQMHAVLESGSTAPAAVDESEQSPGR